MPSIGVASGLDIHTGGAVVHKQVECHYTVATGNVGQCESDVVVGAYVVRVGVAINPGIAVASLLIVITT